MITVGRAEESGRILRHNARYIVILSYPIGSAEHIGNDVAMSLGGGAKQSRRISAELRFFAVAALGSRMTNIRPYPCLARHFS